MAIKFKKPSSKSKKISKPGNERNETYTPAGISKDIGESEEIINILRKNNAAPYGWGELNLYYN